MEKIAKRIIRHKQVRKKIIGTASRPRLCVFRSNKHIYAQIIDDQNSKTLVASSDIGKSKDKTNRCQAAKQVGLHLAKVALKKKITMVVFDRGGYQYHGRVKALAEGARVGGLIF